MKIKKGLVEKEFLTRLFIYKAWNKGMENGMGGIQGTRRMFTRIPRDVIILIFRGVFNMIPENI